MLQLVRHEHDGLAVEQPAAAQAAPHERLAHAGVHGGQHVIQQKDVVGGVVDGARQPHARALPTAEVHAALANDGGVAVGPLCHVHIQAARAQHGGVARGVPRPAAQHVVANRARGDEGLLRRKADAPAHRQRARARRQLAQQRHEQAALGGAHGAAHDRQAAGAEVQRDVRQGGDTAGRCGGASTHARPTASGGCGRRVLRPAAGEATRDDGVRSVTHGGADARGVRRRRLGLGQQEEALQPLQRDAQLRGGLDSHGQELGELHLQKREQRRRHEDVARRERAARAVVERQVRGAADECARDREDALVAAAQHGRLQHVLGLTAAHGGHGAVEGRLVAHELHDLGAGDHLRGAAHALVADARGGGAQEAKAF